jgi:hypothetical protein
LFGEGGWAEGEDVDLIINLYKFY